MHDEVVERVSQGTTLDIHSRRDVLSQAANTCLQQDAAQIRGDDGIFETESGSTSNLRARRALHLGGLSSTARRTQRVERI